MSKGCYSCPSSIGAPSRGESFSEPTIGVGVGVAPIIPIMLTSSLMYFFWLRKIPLTCHDDKGKAVDVVGNVFVELGEVTLAVDRRFFNYHPLILENGNYPYWNAIIKAYTKSIDKRAWHFVLIGWQASTSDSDVGQVPKLEVEWTTEEERVVEYANTLKKKKNVLCALWSDENTSNNSESNKDQVNNYAVFASSVVSDSETNDDFDKVCELNAQLSQENAQLKEENRKLIKQVEAKESLLTEELDNLVNTKKELVETKLLLKKFKVGSNKLDEILSFGRMDLVRGGLQFVNKGKVVIEGLAVFVKASKQTEIGECLTKAIVINTDKK
ncbi:hypothetical protein Gohar_014795, partial [Gossypium harknessii]|nr:hypothetical protein [Gossypium harknessii]